MQPTWGRHRRRHMAAGGARGEFAPLVRPRPGGTSSRPPSAWQLHVEPGLLLNGYWIQICKVSGPSLCLLEWICVTLSLFAHFDCFSYVFHVCALQMHNSPKPMEIISLKLYY
jgi:hypothetical protein